MKSFRVTFLLQYSQVESVALNVQTGMHIATLTKLPYAQGATWDPDLICQPGTRESILAEVMDWIGNSRGSASAKIFCLTGVPGAGKTAIAHSVAKQCHDMGFLATAFFFNREDSQKAPMLLSTIICDLASRFPSFRTSISQAIEKDPSLASAGLTRQFNGLITPYADRIHEPVLIVLDALDEGFSEGLLKVLEEGVCLLPGCFCFFVTTRDIFEVKQLLEAPHVHPRRFDHFEGSWGDDVRKVAKVHLKKVAGKKGLKGWPTVEVEDRIVKRSEGLMIWVVAICQFLGKAFKPQEELEELLNKRLPSRRGAQAEKQIDELYAAILLKQDWEDMKFTEAYQDVMGAILASKVPLTINAIHMLHSGRVEVELLLQDLKPLLLSSEEGRPVEILHQSVHDLLVNRAKDVENWKLFAIDEKLQHKKLATLCIQVINAELSEDTPGTGFVQSRRRIPKIPDDAIPEHVMYACRFWIEHLLSIEEPETEFINGIQLFLTEKCLCGWR